MVESAGVSPWDMGELNGKSWENHGETHGKLELDPLVNVYITMESTLFSGKIQYKWAVFHSYLSYYQRASFMAIIPNL